jgi:hypothetical protein
VRVAPHAVTRIDCHQHSNLKPISISPNLLLSLAPAPARKLAPALRQQLPHGHQRRPRELASRGLLDPLQRRSPARAAQAPARGLQSCAALASANSTPPLDCLKQRRRGGLQRGRWCTCYPASETGRRHAELSPPAAAWSSEQYLDGAAPFRWGLGSVRARRRGRCVRGAGLGRDSEHGGNKVRSI